MMSFQVPSMQWCMYFMFLLYFFIFASFYNQYLFINCRIPNHFQLLYDNIQVLAKITVKFILLFYQKRFKFWFSRRQIITHGMRAPFLKLGRCWWILNCHKSRELLFSGILGGGLISLGETFFAHKLLYKNLNSLFLWIYISQNLTKVLHFSQISQLFSLILFFMQLPRSVVFNFSMTWPWHLAGL